MTFPTPRTPEFSSSSSTVNRVVTLPAGIQAGDMMIAIISGSSGMGSITPPAGWVLLSGGWGNGTSGDGIYWKIAVGGETSATFVTASSTGTTIHCGLAFSGAKGIPEYTFADHGIPSGGSTMDCPSITASWGSDDNLFCAINYWNDASDSPTSYPASYSLMQATVAPGGAGYRTSARQLAAASDNPAAQTTSGTMSVTRSMTFAIEPANAVAVARGSYMMG